GVALTLCAFAVPSQASLFLAFSTTLTGGTFAENTATGNGTFSLSASSGILFNKLTVSFDPIAADNAAWTLTGLATPNSNCTSPRTGLASGASFGGTGTNNETSTANSEQFTFTLTAVPEPVSWLLMGTGLAAMIGIACKKRAAAV